MTLALTAPGKSIAAHMTSYNSPSGNKGGNNDLYAYVLPVNPAKEVASIVFVNNVHITSARSINEVNQPPQANLGDLANTSGGPVPDNVDALTFNSYTQRARRLLTAQAIPTR